MRCKYCGHVKLLSHGACQVCQIGLLAISKENADFFLSSALHLLEITGPTAEMFLRRAKRVADEARGQA